MRIQEEKIELQKNVHRRICVREIIFWLHVLQKMVRDRGEEEWGVLVPPTLQCLRPCLVYTCDYSFNNFRRCLLQSSRVKEAQKINLKKTSYHFNRKLNMLYLSISKSFVFQFTNAV